jgi:hypothetical protein
MAARRSAGDVLPPGMSTLDVSAISHADPIYSDDDED